MAQMENVYLEPGQEEWSPSLTNKAMAWSAHLLTATGTVWGLFSILAISNHQWLLAFMWMAIAVAVASAISAYFYLRCVVQLFTHPGDERPVVTSGLTRIGLFVVSAAIIVVGIMPWTLNSLAMAGN